MTTLARVTRVIEEVRGVKSQFGPMPAEGWCGDFERQPIKFVYRDPVKPKPWRWFR